MAVLTAARRVPRAPRRGPAPVTVAAGPVGFPYQPALDGLRGVAVAAVVLFHLGRLQGGFLGVDLFFVLSGFLITSLLLTEHGGRGRIDLVHFWSRRARRLLPALLVLLAAVAVLTAWLTPAAQRQGFRGDAFATLGYVANWRRTDAALSYWDIFRQPSPLDHTWSLAIEEQFYLVWPLLVVGLVAWCGRRPQVVGAVAAAGAAVSFGLLALLYEPAATNRAYYGTDTRLGATLLGGALAAVALTRSQRPGRSGGAGAVLEGVGLAGAAFAVLSCATVDGTGGWYYRGGLLLFDLAALMVIVAVVGRRGGGGILAAALSAPPLRWLGIISYGIYLWHWPVIVFLTPERTGLEEHPLLLDVLCVAVTLAAAVVSYVVVERPVRRGGLPGWRFVGSVAAASAVVVVAVVAATSGLPRPATGQADAGGGNPFSYLPDDVGPGTPKVLLVGDSGAAGDGLGGEMVRVAEEQGLRMGYSAVWCSILNVESTALDTTTDQVIERAWCPHDRRADWARQVAEYDPDVVVYYLAWAGEVFKEQVDGEWVWDCDEAFDAYLRTELAADVDLLASSGATVVLATSPYSGRPEEASRGRVDCRNDTYRAVAASRPGTAVVDLNAFVETAGDERPTWFADSVHLSPRGTRAVADWLVPQLEALAGVPQP